MKTDEFERVIRGGDRSYPERIPRYFVMEDGKTLCVKAAKAHKQLIYRAMADPRNKDLVSWRPKTVAHNLDNTELRCFATLVRIPAFVEDEQQQEKE